MCSRSAFFCLSHTLVNTAAESPGSISVGETSVTRRYLEPASEPPLGEGETGEQLFLLAAAVHDAAEVQPEDDAVEEQRAVPHSEHFLGVVALVALLGIVFRYRDVVDVLEDGVLVFRRNRPRLGVPRLALVSLAQLELQLHCFLLVEPQVLIHLLEGFLAVRASTFFQILALQRFEEKGLVLPSQLQPQQAVLEGEDGDHELDAVVGRLEGDALLRGSGLLGQTEVAVVVAFFFEALVDGRRRESS